MTYTGLEMGSDEYVLPRLWQNAGQKVQWNQNEAANLADGWRWGRTTSISVNVTCS